MSVYDVTDFTPEAVKELLNNAKEGIEDDETYWRDFANDLDEIRRHCVYLQQHAENRIDELSSEGIQPEDDEA